jgi:hypothetical protein
VESIPAPDSPLRDRLVELLQREAKRAGGYAKLAEEIGSANGKKGIFDHQKLTAIGKRGENRPLYCHELEALDRYFKFRGISFASEVFRPVTLLEALAAAGPVVFLAPVRERPDDERMDLSEWDVKSLTTLSYGLGQAGIRQPEITFREVPYARKHFRKGSRDHENTEWFKLLRSHQGSIVSISSPRASHATECMLAEMFGLEPFRTPEPSDDREFLFVWPRDRNFRSALAVTSTMLKRTRFKAKAKLLSADSYALIADDEVYLDERRTNPGREYGVLAARRRAAGWWVCVAGSTGPATFAAARAAREFVCEMAGAARGPASQTLWAIVEADIEPTRVAADPRQVVSQRILYPRPERRTT